MEYTREHMPRCAEEVETLVKYYFETTKAGEGMDPLEFKWDMYDQLDKRGSLLFISARSDDGVLKGFVDYVILPHLHHRQVIASCDMLAVHPDFRRMGIGGQLMTFGEQWLKPQGVTHIVHNHRLLYNEVPLFMKHGFHAEETSYVKDIR